MAKSGKSSKGAASQAIRMQAGSKTSQQNKEAAGSGKTQASNKSKGGSKKR